MFAGRQREPAVQQQSGVTEGLATQGDHDALHHVNGGWKGLRAGQDDARRAGFHGFDMPLATLYDESFNQPIFWANNLTGASPPLEGSSFSADIKWTIYFNNGGVGTFLPFFFRLLQEMRQRLAQPAHAPSALNIATMLVQAAYVDPSDPTRLFVPTPAPTQQAAPA